MLKEGIMAPDFTLSNSDGEEISLSMFKGKKVVVYFYMKDNTPAWTKQAKAFGNAYDEYEKRDIIVIGISKDSIKSHKNFSDKLELPFILLSDPNQEVIKAYDVLVEKNLFGKKGMGVERTTYLIDEKGIIEKVFKKVKADENAEEILKYLDGK